MQFRQHKCINLTYGFLYRICVDLPDAGNRLKILKIILTKENLEPEFSFEQLANATEGYSGSDLKVIIFYTWCISNVPISICDICWLCYGVNLQNLCVAAAYRPVQELLEDEKQVNIILKWKDCLWFMLFKLCIFSFVGFNCSPSKYVTLLSFYFIENSFSKSDIFWLFNYLRLLIFLLLIDYSAVAILYCWSSGYAGFVWIDRKSIVIFLLKENFLILLMENGTDTSRHSHKQDQYICSRNVFHWPALLTYQSFPGFVLSIHVSLLIMLI